MSNIPTQIVDAVHQLAEMLVMTDPAQVQELSQIHTSLESVAEWAEPFGYGRTAAAATDCARLIEQVILDEVADSLATLDQVGVIVGAIQSVIVENRPEAEAGYASPEPASPSSSTSTSPPTTSPASATAKSAPEQADQTDQTNQAEPLDPAPAPMALDADPELLEEFINEANEHLEQAENCLMNMEADANDSESLNGLFRAFHTIKGVAGFLNLGDVQTLAHEAETLLDAVRKGERELVGASVDLSFDTIDALKRMIAAVTEAMTSGESVAADPERASLVKRLQAATAGELPEDNEDNDDAESADAGIEGQRLGEILIEKGTISPATLNNALQSQTGEGGNKRLGEILAREANVAPREVAQALRTQTAATKQRATAQVRETVKVDAERLDRLVENIGELVIAESMVSQNAMSGMDMTGRMAGQLKELDKITRELQEIGTSLRMIPMQSTFQKMARLVRDVARKAGKQVRFETEGEETELDKMVVEKIGDPLVHMIRNAVDHGLEPDGATRKAAGKDDVGVVKLSAYHRGGNIHIEVRDDGRGLDRERILAKARERGLVGADETPTDRDIFNLIFAPGFSTAQKITDVSGRGVGMDVVRKNIEMLRGQVDIQSEKGRGTTFTIRLPLTLAIIDGMVLRSGNERFIVRTMSINTSLQPDRESITTLFGRGEMMKFQGHMISLVRLSRLFDIEGAIADPTEAVVVVLEDDGMRLGLVIDELVGHQQVVIKPLGEGMQGLPGVAGGAIMPDGQVSLILDITGLAKLAEKGQEAPMQEQTEKD